MSGQLTMYTTPWCGYCRNLKSQLARAGIEIAEVDIERDEAAAEFVMSVNGGNQTVPTVVFPDGIALTNPSAAQVKAQLAASAGLTGPAGLMPGSFGPKILIPNEPGACHETGETFERGNDARRGRGRRGVRDSGPPVRSRLAGRG